MNIRYSLFAGALSLAAMSPAMATAYNFTVDYSGGGSATLAAGSDDPLTTSLIAGDSFVYTLQATGNGAWTTLATTSIFPLFALPVSESATRTGDFTLTLLNNGSSVFSYSELGASNSFVHLGTNTVAFNSGLVFDTFQLSYSILTATDTSTASSLLPWPGQAPEAYSPSAIRFDAAAAVPEPETYALVLAGLAAVGVLARRRRAG